MRPASGVFSALLIVALGSPLVPARGAGFARSASAPIANVRIFRDARRSIGLGAVLTTRYGGQVFNFDVNRNGTDGIVTEAGSYGSALETFDVNSGKITKTVDKIGSPSGDVELVTYGIFAHDLGFVDEEHDFFRKNGVDRNDRFLLLAPNQRGRITGNWTPPHSRNTIIWHVAANQDTAEQATFAYRLPHNRQAPTQPWLYVTDFARNATTGYQLPELFGVQDIPQVAEDTVAHQAVFALTPDAGAVGGKPPVNVLVDLGTGNRTQWNGLNNGPYGAGTVNGLAVDSTTGVMCTTTELNAQVEFYNLATQSGTAAQIPGTGPASEYNSALTVANDPVNHLFLVAQPISTTGQNSSIHVFDESGNYVESINGLNFTNAFSEVFGYPGIALEPGSRLGWVNGPGVDQLQQFFY